jgi:hypothetical protein
MVSQIIIFSGEKVKLNHACKDIASRGKLCTEGSNTAVDNN